MVIRQPPQPEPYVLFQSVPESAIFFLLQPLGIFLETFLAETSLKTWVVGPIWTTFFLLLTVGPYRRACNPLLASVPSVHQWSWAVWLIPSPFLKLYSSLI